MGFIAFLVNDWRYYQMCLTLPGLIFLSYWFVIPESTRWLLANNRKAKAAKQMEKLALSNNVELSKDMLDRLVEGETDTDGETPQNKPSALDLFRLPHLRSKALLM